MATRETPFAAGTPCWADLMTSDTGGAKAFYGALLGWTFEESGPEFGGYINCFRDGLQVAGIMGKTPEMGAMPDVWATYISTEDIKASMSAATEAGGQVVVEPMDVGELGSMGVVLDPAGAAIGMWQPGQHTGFQRYNEPGSVAWHELVTKDFDAATPFYKSVFGWELVPMMDTEEMRYYVANVDGESVAGLMDAKAMLPAEVPSHWAVYFNVEDADEALATATELGATVLRPAEDSPNGRLADLLDPFGAMFKIHSAKLANPPAE